MTSLNRVRVASTGFSGGPGVSTFYFLDTATALPSLHTLFASIAASVPNVVTFVIEPSGDVIDDTTGTITGAWGGSPQAAVVGGRGGPYAAPTGVLMKWGTSTIADGHRVKGRTFLVPVLGDTFTATGSVVPAAQTSIQSAMLEFIIEQSSSFVIWHRPFAGRPAVGTKPAKAAHAGSHALVTTAVCSGKATVLRSRRD